MSVTYSEKIDATEELKPNLTVQIPMRDEIELAADLFYPPNYSKEEKYSCILMRSPAGRKASPWADYAPTLAQMGYIVAIQDTRSAMDEKGRAFPYWSDGWGRCQDGYDTVEWLAKSDFTNGKIGTFGFSAVGITQMMMAPSAPPSLRCQYIGIAAASMYHHATFVGGQLLKNQVEGWLGLYAPDPGVFSHVCNQPFYNDFWQTFDSIHVAHRVKSPAIHYGGWYDTFVQGTIDGYVARQEHGGEGSRGTQKLLLGPWTHFWPEEKNLGDFEVPHTGYTPPIDLSPKRWFDHYLKGVPNGIEDIPNVTYYVMGPFDGSPSSGNLWRHADHWPVPSVNTSFYLSGDNTLIEKIPNDDSYITYEYNPHDPVPTLGGRNLFIDAGPKDQSPLENREDVILFTTQELTEDIEVTGHLKALIYVSSDQDDTDIVVRLCDVYPDGRSILIADGIVRTGIQHHIKGISMGSVEEPSEVEVDLWSTSIVFAKGHQIRVSITSSNYPRFERNVNKGVLGSHQGKVGSAKNTIHMSHKAPSQIILPVVRRGDQWL